MNEAIILLGLFVLGLMTWGSWHLKKRHDEYLANMALQGMLEDMETTPDDVIQQLHFRGIIQMDNPENARSISGFRLSPIKGHPDIMLIAPLLAKIIDYAMCDHLIMNRLAEAVLDFYGERGAYQFGAAIAIPDINQVGTDFWFLSQKFLGLLDCEVLRRKVVRQVREEKEAEIKRRVQRDNQILRGLDVLLPKSKTTPATLPAAATEGK